MSRDCKEQLLVSKMIHHYWRNIIYSMDWLQESIRQPTSQLDSYSRKLCRRQSIHRCFLCDYV